MRPSLLDAACLWLASHPTTVIAIAFFVVPMLVVGAFETPH